jgi:acetyl-CoA carboxylase biotin carboxyl carrier protein
MWKLPDHDLEALIGSFERSDWRELRLRMEGVELVLGKDAAPAYREIAGGVPEDEGDRGEPPANLPNAKSDLPLPSGRLNGAIPDTWKQVHAPSLGTFYRAPKPGVPPFVEIGSEITAETEVCLIEVMKLFTTVRAGVEGTVREIYAADAALVEFDQPLFLVEPRG